RPEARGPFFLPAAALGRALVVLLLLFLLVVLLLVLLRVALVGRRVGGGREGRAGGQERNREERCQDGLHGALLGLNCVAPAVLTPIGTTAKRRFPEMRPVRAPMKGVSKCRRLSSRSAPPAGPRPS